MRYVVALALAGIVSVPAAAVGRLADVSLIDRDSGEKLQTHYYKGEYWVAGRPGAHYAIQIQSRDGRRLLAVTSVDGVNILTGETAGHQQRGYVFAGWQGYDLSGWRKSNSEIAAFTFTAVPKSYAARTGRPDNVGVIGVALFTERQRIEPQVIQEPYAPPAALPPPPPRFESSENKAAPQSTAPSGRAREDSAAADSRALGAAEAQGEAAGNAARREAEKLTRAPAPSLGTGHGRREYSSVVQVAFERARSTPDEVIRIRYDSRDNLVALGVIRRPPPVGPRRVDPFPDTRMGYVPDP